MIKRFTILVVALAMVMTAQAQVDLMPWGNIQGMRIDGQRVPFETYLVVWQGEKSIRTGKEMQRPVYTREGNRRIVKTSLDNIAIEELVVDESDSVAQLTIIATAKEDFTGDLHFAWTPDDDSTATVEYSFKGVYTIRAPRYTLSFECERWRKLRPSSDDSKPNQINGHRYFMPISKNLKKGEVKTISLTIRAHTKVDHTDAAIEIFSDSVGRPFDGFGGNFRLQNPSKDPIVIDYCLSNMRVAWGRAEMPLRLWQPKQDEDPIEQARKGTIDDHVKKSMEMAQRLKKIGMPLILSSWHAPDWAIVGKAKFSPDENGVWGNQLNQLNAAALYKSIADYIVYLKEAYGVEADYFSFNESDLGINIRQTPEEHAMLIKGLGKYFEERGLHTKMLLGDNSDATTYAFIDAAMNDTSTHPYIGAVSFHSWRGWDYTTLKKWADAATRMKLPLIVGEGSIDAQAWGYPMIFEEPSYALDEISLYIRLLNICQPVSILQWQLTSDYSPLAGGGIFGNNAPLHPTQRFWNLKQLASTPKNLNAWRVRSDNPLITVAVLGDKQKNVCTIHLVNRGPSRTINIGGLPNTISTLNVTVVNSGSGIQKHAAVAIKNGKASVTADVDSFITLTTP